MSDVQSLVDDLAAGLGRPVGVDDRWLRALAYSPHTCDVDAVRKVSILSRQTPPDVVRWLESYGISGARGSVRIPANLEHGALPRVCLPLHFGDSLLGYLWLIDEPAVSDAEIKRTRRTADQITRLIYRRERLHEDDRNHVSDLALQLLEHIPGDPTAAARALVDGGWLPQAPGFAATVVRAHGTGPVPESISLKLLDAAECVRRRSPQQHTVLIPMGDLIVWLLGGVSDETATEQANALAVAAGRVLHKSDLELVAGLGGTCTTTDGLGLSYRQAVHAIQVGIACRNSGTLVCWADLGAYRTLFGLLAGRDPVAFLPSSVSALLEADRGGHLTLTLERYLELGCNVSESSRLLMLHRSSLYRRLQRIEEITGRDLRSGDDRLELQLGLRLWRLSRNRPNPA